MSGSLVPCRAPVPAPSAPPRSRALSSHPREGLGCECDWVISSDQKAHYLEVQDPRQLPAWPARAGVGGTLALPTLPIFTLSLRGPAPRKPETSALGREGSLVTSGLLGG